MTIRKKPFAQKFGPYDHPENMSQKQLELAWIASIYFRPGFAKQIGLRGIDQSMFENKNIFEIGLEMLRCEDFVEKDEGLFPMPPPHILEKLMKLKLVSAIEGGFNEMYFLPALYEKYCEELEARHEFLE